MQIGGGQQQVKPRRQRAIVELVASVAIGSQEELAELLRGRGFEVTQATVSRDVAELGLVKAPRGERHVYLMPENAARGDAYDARLRRLLEDIPVRIGRSGLSLVLTATPGSAGAIAQAIDQSSLSEQVGTLAGDNTLLVLFEDEASLERWRGRFQAFQPRGEEWTAPVAALPSTNGRPAAALDEGPPAMASPIAAGGPAASNSPAARVAPASPPAAPSISSPVHGGAPAAPTVAHSEAPR